MFSLTILLLLFPIAFVNCIQIPFIQNVTLVPRYKWNSTTSTNRTYEQCLCMSLPSFVAFNYFPNNTCQLFYTFPITYKIQSTPLARLYFPQGIFPNASQCCMFDLSYLLNKLKNGTWTYINITEPRNLLIDNNGYLVTVDNQPFRSTLNQFDAQTLTLINQTSIDGSYVMALGFVNNAYFAGHSSDSIVVIDSENLTVINQITSSYIQDLRGIIFLNNGRTMVITSPNNQAIVFFDQSDNASLSYTYAYQQSVNYAGVHGLTSYNDTYFFATSWKSSSVYSYTAVTNSTSWIEKLLINATSVGNTVGGSFVTIDECGRYWVPLSTSVVYIFDSLGSLIGNISLEGGQIFDVLITDNYVMYFSDRNTDWSRIIRIDPHIESCPINEVTHY